MIVKIRHVGRGILQFTQGHSDTVKDRRYRSKRVSSVARLALCCEYNIEFGLAK